MPVRRGRAHRPAGNRRRRRPRPRGGPRPRPCHRSPPGRAGRALVLTTRRESVEAVATDPAGETTGAALPASHRTGPRVRTGTGRRSRGPDEAAHRPPAPAAARARRPPPSLAPPPAGGSGDRAGPDGPNSPARDGAALPGAHPGVHPVTHPGTTRARRGDSGGMPKGSRGESDRDGRRARHGRPREPLRAPPRRGRPSRWRARHGALGARGGDDRSGRRRRAGQGTGMERRTLMGPSHGAGRAGTGGRGAGTTLSHEPDARGGGTHGKADT